MPPQQAKMMTAASYVLTPLTVFFTLKFNAGLQLFLVTSGVLQGLQSYLTLQPWFRKVFGLAPLHRHVPTQPTMSRLDVSYAKSGWQAPRTISTTATVTPAEPAADKTKVLGGLMDKVSEGTGALTEKVGEWKAKSAAKEKRSEAAAYEQRRKLEEQQRYRARLEEQRRKASSLKQQK